MPIMDKYTALEPLTESQRNELKEYSDIVAHLLFHRGITTSKDAGDFINPSYEDNLHDPFLFKDMDKATDRILKAIKEKESICIYSDYDADGVPGAVILNDFFRKVGVENFEVYIPHRNKEGFGLNKKAIEGLHERGVKLIITIDCGIADAPLVKYANELGMEVVITDHHEPHDDVPEAHAIVNHKQKGCEYPEKILCGSGVVFKLVQALIQKGDFGLVEGWEKWLLDMVGIATLSDMVPLRGENRALVHYGMHVLRKSPRKGLHQLLKKTGTNQRFLNEEDVGFTISPRINAASRMGVPKKAFEMLSATDDIDAKELVNYLHEINNERKGLVASMVKEIRKHLSKTGELKILAMGNVSWKPSLLGLAANTVMNDYGIPVFLWGRGEGQDLKGSCRVPEGFSGIDLMNNLTKGTLETYGGHHQAGGFVVGAPHVDLLQGEFEKSFESLYKEGKPVLKKQIDYILNPDDITESLFRDIEKLSPFGMNNERPTFLIKECVVKEVSRFGADKGHIRINIERKNSDLESIAFFIKEGEWDKIKTGQEISVVGKIEKSYFNRPPKVRLRIDDVLF